MATETQWGVDSEYGRLRDVLLCPPDHYRWRATSPISQATLDSGRPFDSDLAHAQHAEMVACYEEAEVRCHFLEADSALPYQVFARDSSASSPAGSIVLQPQQWWRRGEYAAVIRFLQEREIPIRAMVTAAAVEGGDVMIVEPGCVLIGYCEARTQEAGARQLASFYEAEGWEARVQPFSARYVHIDVLVAVLSEKLAAVCEEAVPAGLIRWLREKGIEIIPIPEEQAFALGVNAMSLGDGQVLSGAGASTLNAGLRAHGLTVLEPELSMFTLGGGGAHCLAQALRRERVG
jgi:N-dimethylarginine dimethylaminohydrolase